MCCVWRESAGNVVNNIYLIVILMRLILMIVADTRRGASCDTQHGRRLELSMNFREVSQWTEKTTYLLCLETSVYHSIFLSVEVLLGVFNKEKALLGTIKHLRRFVDSSSEGASRRDLATFCDTGPRWGDPGPVWRHGHCERSGHAAVIT